MQSPSSQPRIALLVVLLSMVVSSVGCTARNPNYVSDNPYSQPRTTESGTTEKQLEELNIAVIPHRSSKEEEHKMSVLADYLQQVLGLPVNIQLTKDYETSIDLLVTQQVQMAYLGPFAYVKAKERNSELEPIVSHIEKTTGRPWYTSAIVVNTESAIAKVEDLQGKRFGFVSESSTSGYLFPSAHLQKSGLNPKTDFAAIHYAGSHDNNVTALAEGEVDAIAINKSTYLLAKESGTLPESQYQIIWESEPIPNSPIVISNQLPTSLKFKLKKALINAPSGVVAVGGMNADGYTLVEDEDYEPIREVKKLLDFENF